MPFIYERPQKKSLPMRMKAYERVVMLLERITPNHLVIRVMPGKLTIGQYRKTLVEAVNKIRLQYHSTSLSKRRSMNHAVSAKSQATALLTKS